MITPFILIVFLFFLSALAYIKSRSLISPFMIVPLIWATIICCYLIIPHDLHILGAQFFSCVALWCAGFWLGGLLIDSSPIHMIRIKRNDASKIVKDVFFYVCLFSTPLICYSLFKAASNGPAELLFLNLRELNTGTSESDFSLGPLAYVFSIAFVALMIELVEQPAGRIFTSRVIILLGINITLAILTVGRTSFVYLFVGILIMLNFRGLIRFKHVMLFVSGICLLFLIITLLRSTEGDEGSTALLSNTLKIYMFSGLPAFQTLNYDAYQTQFGGNLFRFFYAVAGSLGFPVEVKKTIYEYTYIPYPTNVYTVMYPFFTDFGRQGIVIGSFIYGCFYQFWYKTSLAGIKISRVFFSFIFTSLILQFFGEYLLTNLSSSLQYLILAIMPYAIGNKKS